MKRRTKQYEVFTREDGEELELEFPIQLESWEEPDIIIQPTESYVIMGYLAHDNDCENPLESCDAMGMIHHHPSSRYGSRNSDYYNILGCDSYGDSRIDEDRVQSVWENEVYAKLLDKLPDAMLTRLAREEAGEYEVEEMCRWAWRNYYEDLSDEEYENYVSIAREHLTWNWDEVREACRERGDVDAVLLDRYEHGLCRYTVHSDGGCRWDTSRGEAVWVPDRYLREELEKITDPAARYAQAVTYAEQACDVYTDWANGNCYGYVVAVYDQADGSLVEEDSCWGFIGDEYAEEERDRMIEYFVKKFATRLPNASQLTLPLTTSESEGVRE